MDKAQIPGWLARGHAAMQATFPPRTRKQMAALMLDSGLWSSNRLSLESAVARVGDCLHPERGGGQGFRVSEVWLWMRESGQHALFEAMGADLGRRTDPIPTAERQSELLTRIDGRLEAIAAELADLQALREELTGGTPSIKPLARESAPTRFSQYDADRGF